MNARIVGWSAIVLWAASALVVGFLFLRGQTDTAADGRTAILLEQRERDIVLTEMRAMLEAVRGVTEALADGEMAGVSEAASVAGAAMVGQVPPQLMLKLPLEFKQLGGSVHTGFDEIAAAAGQGEGVDMILARLGAQLGRCTACHETFRLP